MTPAEALRTRGYAVFPALYPAGFLAAASAALARIHVELGRPPLHGPGKTELAGGRAIVSGTGLMLTSLLSHAPELVDGYLAPELRATLAEVLGPKPRLETTAATLSDAGRNPMLTWHNHIGGLDEDLYRAVDYETLDPTRVRRVTVLIYLDGVGREAGPLLVLPRRLGDPIANPSDDPEEDDYRADWAGRELVEGPPGTAVIVEERTWHASLARTGPGLRRFVGAMVAASWAPPAANLDRGAAAVAGAVLGGGRETG